MEQLTELQWFDRLHILSTFAVKIRAQQREWGRPMPDTDRIMARDALIATLGLEQFGTTAAESVFADAYSNEQPYAAARAAFQK